MILYPTHHCFDDAIEFIAEFVAYYPDSVDSLRVVHAICRSDDNTGNTANGNVLYIHAYVKSLEDNLCFFDVKIDDKQLHCMVETAQYETALHIQTSIQYTIRQVLRECRKSDTAGPWRQDFIDFCNKSDFEPKAIMGQLKNIKIKLFERRA